MTMKEAREVIDGRKGWLGVEEHGKYVTYSFYKKRPLTDFAYPLFNERQKEKAAELLVAINPQIAV